MHPIGFLASTVSALAVLPPAHVLVVDPNGGSGTFPTIRAAVLAASDEDTILVKTGTYNGFEIDGKALTILADSSANVQVEAPGKVQNLPTGKVVVLDGMHIFNSVSEDSFPDEDNSGLYVHANAGPVRIQDCTIEGGFGFDDTFCGCAYSGPCDGGYGAMVVANPAGVAFVGCTITGGSSVGVYSCDCEIAVTGTRNGYTGLLVKDTVVALDDCTVRGGAGGPGCNNAGDGGRGIRVTQEAALTGVVLSGCTVRGGAGGGAPESGEPCIHGGNGGDGMLVDPGTSSWVLDSSFVGGAGAHGTSSSGTTGQTLTGPGDVFQFPEPRLRLELPSPVRESQTVPVTVRGRPGDEVFVFMGPVTPFRPMTAWHGVLLASAPHPMFVGILGTIPASGVLSGSFTAQDLPPSDKVGRWFVQVWRRSAIDGRTLGSLRVLNVLDSSL